ncbi:MAG TPA: permease-like cell division protein FtsX [Vicinamibacteria bacterium]|nr:permease-like cell division protein FtsX [Vicinamibacteria bacterium]
MKLLRALGYSIEEAVVELWRNRLVNLISIATIAVSLFILGIFLAISANLNELMEGWASRVQLTLYLEPEATGEEEETLRDLLAKSPEVESFDYVSKEAAVSRFRSYFPELEALPDLLETNPLPASFEVSVAVAYRAPEQVRAFARRLDAVSGVSEVDYDLLWIERLSSIIELTQVLGLAVGAALVLASVFTIFNVIKLTVYGRQDEIGIMRLVGATHAYIRGPFLVEGILQGGLGGLLALALLYLSHEFLLREALRSFQLLPAADWLHFVPPSTWLFIVAAGMLVGLLGSLLSVRKFLASPV